jgi:hypothetical protein
MPKKYLFGIIFILIIFTSGCQTGVYNPDKTLQTTDFHTGTEGIYMRFLQDTPPRRIYTNTPMEIMVEYSNKGAGNIAGGKLYLSGFDKQYIMPYPEMQPNIEAEGKSAFNPYGTITQIATFSVSQVTLPYNVDKVTQTIKATACYEYMTEASIEVCIDPKTTTTLRERTCMPQSSYSAGSGQGAPVAVTRVEQETYQNKLQFRIYFSNVGGGTVLKNTAINDCHTSLNRVDANKLEVVSVEYSGKTMNCKPLNPITLDESGNGFVFCESYLSPDQKDTYKTVLQIKLRYGYRSSIQTDVDILKSP